MNHLLNRSNASTTATPLEYCPGTHTHMHGEEERALAGAKVAVTRQWLVWLQSAQQDTMYQQRSWDSG